MHPSVLREEMAVISVKHILSVCHMKASQLLIEDSILISFPKIAKHGLLWLRNFETCQVLVAPT
jgi:hypothetical protein